MYPLGHVAAYEIRPCEPFIILDFWLGDIYSHEKQDARQTRPTLYLFTYEYAHVSGLSIASLRSGQLNPL